MKTSSIPFTDLLGELPREKVLATEYQFDVADRIDALMQERGYNQKTFAQAIGHRPSEVHRWLSGEHNFTLKTIALLSEFFGKPIINILK